MVKAIIFDLDGTLVDTSRDIHKVLNTSLQKYSVPQITLRQTIEFVGNGAKKLVERAAGEEYASLVPEIYADFSRAFVGCDNALTTLYDGEEQALKDFGDRKIRLAILTNKPQRAAENVCKKHLDKFGFDFVVGQTDGVPLKPDPYTTLKLIEKFGVKKSECVFVGDGETDVQTAARAGIKCISVLWGFRTRSQLLNAGGSIFAESYNRLQKLIYSL